MKSRIKVLWKFLLSLAIILVICFNMAGAREFDIEKLRENFGARLNNLKDLKISLEKLKTQYPNIKPLLETYNEFINKSTPLQIEIRGGRETQNEMDELYELFKELDEQAESNPLKKEKSLSSPAKNTLKRLIRSLRDLRYWFRDYRDSRRRLLWRYDKTIERVNRDTEKYHLMLSNLENFLNGLSGEPFDAVKPVLQRVKNASLECEQAVKAKESARTQKSLLERLIAETEELSAISNTARYYDFPDDSDKKGRDFPAKKAKKLSIMAMELADFTKIKLSNSYKELIDILGDLKGSIK
ncbi:MAG: hypothetical protein J7M18_04130 [Candidatus Eremiobacteraeota bacterium]|nr:hypothetical protein [Candidatus Eremiobacteraeota bacterium]